MTESLANLAFAAVNTEEFSTLSRKARLEAFTYAYCRTVAEAPDDAVEREANAIGVPVARLRELREIVNLPRTQVLAEVLRLFGDRAQQPEVSSDLDRLFDEIMGTSGGYEGTIPGDAPVR